MGLLSDIASGNFNAAANDVSKSASNAVSTTTQFVSNTVSTVESDVTSVAQQGAKTVSNVAAAGLQAPGHLAGFVGQNVGSGITQAAGGIRGVTSGFHNFVGAVDGGFQTAFGPGPSPAPAPSADAMSMLPLLLVGGLLVVGLGVGVWAIWK